MKLHFLYKSTNRVNGKVFYGIHASEDLAFGSKDSTDPYCGSNDEIMETLQKYGRNAFFVEAIHAFATLEEAQRILPRYAIHNTYKEMRGAPPGNTNALGYVTTPEISAKLSEIRKGEKNGFYDKEHSSETKEIMSEFRSQMKWITNGEEEKQILKTEAIPEGFVKGRKKKKSAKEIIEQGKENV